MVDSNVTPYFITGFPNLVPSSGFALQLPSVLAGCCNPKLMEGTQSRKPVSLRQSSQRGICIKQVFALVSSLLLSALPLATGHVCVCFHAQIFSALGNWTRRWRLVGLPVEMIRVTGLLSCVLCVWDYLGCCLQDLLMLTSTVFFAL